jgi:nitrogen fixation NifU-like protein
MHKGSSAENSSFREDHSSISGDTMYREHILDHYQHPRNKGTLRHPDVTSTMKNPLCGDEITIAFKVDKAGKISDIAFLGAGCAISQAAASLLTEEVKGKTLAEVKAITNDRLLELLHIPLGPVRIKCALLSLKIIEQGIQKYEVQHETARTRHKKSPR